MWHAILGQYFPTKAGYIEASHRYGRSDIVVYEHRLSARGRRKRRLFLIIQCKRVKYQKELDEMDLG